MKRGLAVAAGLLAAGLALYALLAPRGSAPPPEEEIDDASRAALREVLRQEDE